VSFETYAGSVKDLSFVGLRETLPRIETHLGHFKMLTVRR
jgi:hypothetical protein